MIGQFERGTQFRSKEEVAIFETIPEYESQTGLCITKHQIWEIDGYNDKLDLYILICRQAGIALKMTLEDIETIFERVPLEG